MKLLRSVYAVGFLFALVFSALSSFGQATVQRVIFLSGEKALEGCIYKPAGKGPFPVIVYAQGSSQLLPGANVSDPFPQLGGFYNSKGFVLFVPGRHDPAGAVEAEESESIGGSAKTENPTQWTLIQAHHLKNLTNAIAWLQAQSFVDENKIILTGSGPGAATVMLAGEKKLGIRGVVLFTVGPGSIRDNEIFRPPLLKGIKSYDVPVFYIQTMSDASQKPANAIAPVLERKGSPNRVKIYGKLPKGQTAQTFSAIAPQTWGPDVLAFIGDVLK